MSKTTLRIRKDVFGTFQETVEEEWGKLKGAQNEALNEAVLLWLAYKKDVPVALLNHNRTGRKEVLLQGELSNRLTQVLGNTKEDVGVWPVGKNHLVRGIYVKILDALVRLFGRPDASAVENLDTGETLEVLDAAHSEGWIEKLFEYEDGLLDGEKVSLVLSWKEKRVRASLSPTHISVIRVPQLMPFDVVAESRSRSKVP